MTHLLSILFFFFVLVGLGALLEAIVRENMPLIRGALFPNPRPRRLVRAQAARLSAQRAAA